MTSPGNSVEMNHMASEIDLEAGLGRRAAHERQQSCCGKFCGFLWKDWTQVVGRIGVLGGLVTGGVGLALQNPYVVAGGVAAVVVAYFFPDCGVSCYKPEKELEDTVEDFGEENVKFQKQIDTLAGRVKELEGIRDDLQRQLGDAQNTVRDLNRTLLDRTAEIRDRTEEIRALTEKVSKLEHLVGEYKKTTKALAKEIALFNKTNNVFKVNIGSLSGEVDELDKHEDDLSDEVGELGEKNTSFEAENQKLQQMVAGLTLNLSALKEGFTRVRADLDEW
jgi:peptidoglycan hydrolase CwlO-like protein